MPARHQDKPCPGSSLSGTNLPFPNSSNGSGRVALLGLCALLEGLENGRFFGLDLVS